MNITRILDTVISNQGLLVLLALLFVVLPAVTTLWDFISAL